MLQIWRCSNVWNILQLPESWLILTHVMRFETKPDNHKYVTVLGLRGAARQRISKTNRRVAGELHTP